MFHDVPTFLLAYVTGLLCVGTFVIAWFKTSFPLVLLHRWYPEFFLTSDLFDYWATNPPFGIKPLGKLLTCSICFSTWFSVAVSGLMYLAGAYGSNSGLVACLAFGWPFCLDLLRKS